jgi:cytochrome b561
MDQLNAASGDVTIHATALITDAPKARAGQGWPRYTPAMQVMHWGTLTLLVCAYAVAWTIDSASNAANAAWLIMLHRSLGIAILLITGIRLVVRRRTRIPPLPRDVPAAQRLAARVSAVLLYALLIAQPLLGLAASALHGDRIVLFGRFGLPRLLPEDRTLAHAVFQVHGAAALLCLVLIGLHATAAIYHHVIRKDHVLAAMLPGVRMKPGRTGSAP